MLYSILIYDVDEAVDALSPEEDAALMARHLAVQDRLRAEGKLGPVVRLSPSAAARTLRPGDEPLVTDGPFAETKEQLLGLYVVDCATADEAAEIAHSLPVLSGVFEIRPVRAFFPGGELTLADQA